MKTLNIAYGTLDLRIKQGLDLAERQIEDLSKKKPTEVYFDIIHTANQTPLALTYLPEVKALIRRFNKLADMTVHLNTNDRILRARNALYKKIHDNDVKVNHKAAV